MEGGRRQQGVLALYAAQGQEQEEVLVGDVVEFDMLEGGKAVGLVEEVSFTYSALIMARAKAEFVIYRCHIEFARLFFSW